MGILESTAQGANNPTVKEAARRSALTVFRAASMMPVPTMMQLCRMCGLRPRVPGFEVCSMQCRASLAMLNNVDVSVRQSPGIPALSSTSTTEALRTSAGPN